MKKLDVIQMENVNGGDIDWEYWCNVTCGVLGAAVGGVVGACTFGFFGVVAGIYIGVECSQYSC